MKKALITGATGFIGANLARELTRRKFIVNVLTRTKSNLWRLSDIKDKIDIHNADILDINKLSVVVHDIKPDYIFHLAAYGAYPRIETDEKAILQTNIIGTYNLLKATLGIPYSCFINTGSSSEYGTKNKAMKECDAPEPNTFYGATKAAATMLCQNFARQHKKPIITLRHFSAYGYYEEPFRLIPNVIINCINQKDVHLTSGEQKRDFVFIEDVIDAYMKAIKKPSSGLVLNVGSGSDVSVKEVASLIHRLMKSGNKLLFGKKNKEQFETDICWKADTAAIKRTLNWKAKTSLISGLKKTIAWFRQNMELYEKKIGNS